MYVSSLLDKESGMYPGPGRAAGSHPPGSQGFVPAPPYPEYLAYPPGPGLDPPGQPPGPWGSPYGPQRDDWPPLGPGPAGAAAQLSAPSPAPGSYSPAEYSALQPGAGTVHGSPGTHRHGSFEWGRRAPQANAAGKTRTKEKYRVVYTDHQRLELEKEFHCNRYITIRRKSELAANLGLSERQVKIWFQNRRAKERKLMKKKISQFDGSGGSAQSDSGSLSPNELSSSLFPPPHGINGLQPSDIHQVIVSE
ncbi:CDX4 protein, partial [Grallaria varia]|nr:CDX4 protein [Grallaria varia]